MLILLADDEEDSRSYLARFIRELGHQVVEAKDGLKAWELFPRYNFHLVLSDIRMPGLTGLELLQHIHSMDPPSESDIVLFTAHAQVKSTIEALRYGAYDYLLKPINIKELTACLERVEEHQHLRKQNKVLTDHFQASIEAATRDTRRELEQWKTAYANIAGIGNLIVASPVMQGLYAQALILHSDPTVPVLIEGETGTGKEILARYIHYGHEAITIPFIDINCAAIPASTFESELFGYDPGTFTGALPKGRKGKMDLARGGTLFLDEITEMPLELQAKLLRVVQEREFYRMGGLKKNKFEARLVSSTNVNILEYIEDGKFRRDLYYRLGTASLRIPPLRERREEILPLAEYFLTHFSQKKGKFFRSISPEAKKQLLKYEWPGNVRQLRNTLERAVLMNNDIILQPEHLQLASIPGPNHHDSHDQNHPFILTLQSDFKLPSDCFPLNEHINRVISQALEINNGNVTSTSRYLGLSRRSLDYRLHKNNLNS
ncbi:MAG TPA: sigma-54 dependent transcriptional regulator [Syntrophomonadaceae bacterium]|nr:sigma-54 dependent transcriptional regulator [Syntrophomonadaceae bacterium]